MDREEKFPSYCERNIAKVKIRQTNSFLINLKEKDRIRNNSSRQMNKSSEERERESQKQYKLSKLSFVQLCFTEHILLCSQYSIHSLFPYFCHFYLFISSAALLLLLLPFKQSRQKWERLKLFFSPFSSTLFVAVGYSF